MASELTWRSPIHSRKRGIWPSQPYSFSRVVEFTTVATRWYIGLTPVKPPWKAVE